MRVAESNRLATALEQIRPEIREHIRNLDKCIKEFDRELRAGLRASPVWREHENLLRGIPGVSPVLTIPLLADVPELGTLPQSRSRRWSVSRHSIAIAAAGAANAPSGVAELQSTRCCTWPPSQPSGSIPPSKVLYERLIHAGKPRKVALTACMYKLLRTCNAILSHHTAWRYQPLDS